MASTYQRKIDGILLHVSPHSKGHQWGIQIDGESKIHPQIIKGENFKGEAFWRIRPGSLPDGFNHQFHKSLNDALKTIARLYKEWKMKKGGSPMISPSTKSHH